MTPPKSAYAADPFLTALAAAPRQQLLTRQQAAGFLGISLTTLDEWRSRSLPPPWTDLRGMIRYKCGDVMDFVDNLPTSQLEAQIPAVAGITPPTPDPAPAGDLQRLGMYAPIMRGGRRKKITSFATWLTDGDPVGPPWRFAMIDDLGSQETRRPVDLIATLDFVELGDDVPCVELTMLEYARSLAAYAEEAMILFDRDQLDQAIPASKQELSNSDDGHL